MTYRMGKQPSLRLGLLALSMMLSLPGSGGEKGRFKVGVCDPGFVPFIMVDSDGNIEGYEVVQWAEVYSYARERVQSTGNDYLMGLMGDESPDLMPMSWEEVMDSLSRGELDVGMCGFYINAQRLDTWNFLPSYLSTGMRALVRRTSSVSVWQVLSSVFGTTNAWAVFSMEMLLVFGVVYGHVAWYLEHRDNVDIDAEYGPGVFNAFHLGLSTALTMTFGDIRPVTVPGKVLTFMWMISASFFLALFIGSVTSEVLRKREGKYEIDAINLDRPSDLTNYKVGTAYTIATDAVRLVAPNSDIIQYSTQPKLLEALAVGEIDIAVDDGWTGQYLANTDEVYRDKVIPKGSIFHKLEISVAFSRPQGLEHPLFRYFSQAMVDYMSGVGRSDHTQLLSSWFGEEINSDNAKYTDNEMVESGLAQVNVVVWAVFAPCLFLWAVAVLSYYRGQIMTTRKKVALRNALGITSTSTKGEVRERAKDLFCAWATERQENRRGVDTPMRRRVMTIADIVERLKDTGTIVSPEEVVRMLSVADNDVTSISSSNTKWRWKETFSKSWANSFSVRRPSRGSSLGFGFDQDPFNSPADSFIRANQPVGEWVVTTEKFQDLIENLISITPEEIVKEGNKLARAHHVVSSADDVMEQIRGFIKEELNGVENRLSERLDTLEHQVYQLQSSLRLQREVVAKSETRDKDLQASESERLSNLGEMFSGPPRPRHLEAASGTIAQQPRRLRDPVEFHSRDVGGISDEEPCIPDRGPEPSAHRPSQHSELSAPSKEQGTQMSSTENRELSSSEEGAMSQITVQNDHPEIPSDSEARTNEKKDSSTGEMGT